MFVFRGGGGGGFFSQEGEDTKLSSSCFYQHGTCQSNFHGPLINNLTFKYVMKEGFDMQTLQTTEGEQDLGVIVNPDLNFEKHIAEKVKKANSISGFLMRTITYKTKDIKHSRCPYSRY